MPPLLLLLLIIILLLPLLVLLSPLLLLLLLQSCDCCPAAPVEDVIGRHISVQSAEDTKTCYTGQVLAYDGLTHTGGWLCWCLCMCGFAVGAGWQHWQQPTAGA